MHHSDTDDASLLRGKGRPEVHTPAALFRALLGLEESADAPLSLEKSRNASHHQGLHWIEKFNVTLFIFEV